jgi:hypothetical protein
MAADLDGNLIRVFYAFIDFPALRANQTLKIPSSLPTIPPRRFTSCQNAVLG